MGTVIKLNRNFVRPRSAVALLTAGLRHTVWAMKADTVAIARFDGTIMATIDYGTWMETHRGNRFKSVNVSLSDRLNVDEACVKAIGGGPVRSADAFSVPANH